MSHCAGPDAGDHFDPFDVTDVRERVVQPVVSSLIRPADVQRIDVGWGPREALGASSGASPDSRFNSQIIFSDTAERRLQLHFEDELWILVRARGHTWQSQHWQIESVGMISTTTSSASSDANQLVHQAASA